MPTNEEKIERVKSLEQELLKDEYEYKGNFDDSARRHGPGSIKFKNGDIFHVNWEKGLPNGGGVLLFSDNTRFEGVWDQGNISNEGNIIDEYNTYKVDFTTGNYSPM